MSFPEFLSGLIQLALAAGLNGFIAYRLRARLLPGWTGAPARLIEMVTGTGILVVSAELFGLFGLLQALPLLLLLGAGALIVWLRLLPRAVSGDDVVPPAPAVSLGPQLLAAAVVFAVFAQWGAFTSYNLDHGIGNFDSVWYHMPFAAEIARTGSVTTFFHPETVFANWFYPQNSELLHAVGIVLTDRDFISVFINLGWLAVGLLAGWCVGRPYGRPHLTMLGVAVLMATHTLVVREPGTGKNDIMAAVLILAAVAIMLNRSSAGSEPRGRVSPDWAMAAAGLAAGLAIGTKVTAIAPGLMIAFVVIFSTLAGKRLWAVPVFVLPALLGGGWWYLRNLIQTGNPVPQITSVGPFELNGPDLLQVGRPDFSVAHYLTDGTVWKEYFLPGLEQGFGPAWPLLMAMVLIGLVLVLWKGPGRLTRAHAGVALLAIGVYLVTPLGAAGPEGHPTGFAINLRFLVPALGMAVVLIPLASSFDRGWPRHLLVLVLAGLFVATSSSDPVISAPGRVFGFAIALLFVALPAAFWFGRERLSRWFRSPALVPGFGLALVLFAVLAWPLQSTYFENRYREFEPGTDLQAAYRWANDTSDARIALAGITAGFKRYGFFGGDLSNEVAYLGQEAPSGGFNAIGTCKEFVHAVNKADPDYLVTSPYLNFNDYEHPIRSPETLWALSQKSLQPEVAPRPDSQEPVIVWRVEDSLDPLACKALGPEADYIPGLR